MQRATLPPVPAVTLDTVAKRTERMLLVAGEGHVDMIPVLDDQTIVLGRDPTCDVLLVHPEVSRRHAAIHGGASVVIEDLGSRNGVRVAGRRLTENERVAVELGTSVLVGPYVAVLLESRGGEAGEANLRAALPVSDPTPGGVSEVVARVAAGMVSVLITGETGTGKEVLARTVHELSGRAGELVAINCASLSETLLESELFGHERGSFTGAGFTKRGLFEVATGGTVFLDEIGELPAGLQAKLLRALETRTVYRVGGIKPVSLDVRFIAATHRDLAADVARDAFRRDLYFRVNGITLALLPLRDRRAAIPRLAAELLARSVPPDRATPRLSASALDVLLRHDWPGNVRELRTVMERAAVVCEGDEILASDILLDEPSSPGTAPAPPRPQPSASEEEERARIVAALKDCAGNQTYAARQLGMSRTTLVQKLAVHRIPRPRKRRT
jgi:two-component system response regulator AtoC